MTPPFPPIDLVVFDLDGVIADSSPAHAKAYAELWARLRIEGPPYDAISGERTADVVRRETRSLPVTDATRAEWVRFKQGRSRDYLARDPGIFPDVGPSLGALTRAGVALAVGTGASRETATDILARGGILGYFPVIVTGDDVSIGKPDPEVFRLAIDARGHRPERALVIEDAKAGLDAADRAGAWSVTVRTGAPGSGPRWLGAWAGVDQVTTRILAAR